MIKEFILKRFTFPLKAKRIIWGKYLKIYCDGGEPIFRYYPIIHFRNYFSRYWGMYGCRIYFLGREFNFCFGADKKRII